MIWWGLRRKLHSSWLVCIGCFCLLIGLLLARDFAVSDVSILFFGIIFVLVGLFRKNFYLIPAIIIGSVMIGLFRGSVVAQDVLEIEKYYGKTLQIIGSVGSDVDTGTDGRLVIHLNNITINNQNIAGTIWVSAENADIKRGDSLIISGKLTKGFGNFNGKIYQAKIMKIIHPKPGDIARQFRDWFVGLIKFSIPEPESSLGVGYLVGQKQSLPADLVLALQAAGLTHVVVASGYNLTILVRLARRLFERISKYLSILSAGLMIFCFIAITGVSPSMSRAGLVASLSLLAWYYGRRFHPIILISIAMATTAMINPGYIWGDLGWQLSFAAFAGVMILAPLLSRFYFGDQKLGIVRQVLIETISAQLLTAPIIIASFGQISNVAIITNLLVLPLVPLAMLFTFIAGIASAVVPFAATIISLPATWLLGYMINVVNYFAGLPWAVTIINIGFAGVVICYIVIALAALYLSRVTKYNLRDVNLVE